MLKLKLWCGYWTCSSREKQHKCLLVRKWRSDFEKPMLTFSRSSSILHKYAIQDMFVSYFSFKHLTNAYFSHGGNWRKRYWLWYLEAVYHDTHIVISMHNHERDQVNISFFFTETYTGWWFHFKVTIKS